MRLTDIFIEKPVSSIVLTLLVVLFGTRGLLNLPTQRFPQTTSAVIEINTIFYGADAQTMAGFITTPIENVVTETDGVDYIESQSGNGSSSVKLHLRLNVDPKPAVAQAQALVSSIMNKLPAGTQQPAITISNNEGVSMYISFSSERLRPEQVSDYVTRIAIPRLQAIKGVMRAEDIAQATPAMRIWLDPIRLAGLNLTASEVAQMLKKNDYVTGIGQTLGGKTYLPLSINSSLHSAQDFGDLILIQSETRLIRLKDVANVEYGPENTQLRVAGTRGPGAFVAITLAPGANLLSTETLLSQTVAEIKGQMPAAVTVDIVSDAADFVRASLREVTWTLLEAIIIVTFVTFLFLGSIRSAFIPLLVIPVSLIGTFFFMSAAGFSINTLTLLALVLAIGLVVDDAIIVVEHVNARLADGDVPHNAAIHSARALNGPIVAMTLVLIAVYVPIALQKGVTGALFVEFAFTLVASVTVSALLALTLSPMLCARVLSPHGSRSSAFVEFSDRILHYMQHAYRSILAGALKRSRSIALISVLIIILAGTLLIRSQSELAPEEDTGTLIVGAVGPPTTNTDAVQYYDKQVADAFRSLKETENFWIIDQSVAASDGITLRPWDERKRNAMDIGKGLQEDLNKISGLEFAVYQNPPLPGATGFPVQFVIKGGESPRALGEISKQIIIELKKTGKFSYVDSDLKFDQPQVAVALDRNKLAEEGLTVADVGDSLNWLLGGSYVNYFSRDERSYRVMPLVSRHYRTYPEQISNYVIAHISSSDGKTVVPVPLSSVASLSYKIGPESVSHFQGMMAVTIGAVPARGVTVGEAYRTLLGLTQRMLPRGYSTDSAGSLRNYLEVVGSFWIQFCFGMAVIFLALSALFNSFRDPVIILIAVPVSLVGSALFLWLGVGGATLNVYSQVGLITLGGLISKHGILIVEVANDLQKKGVEKTRAVTDAAITRLRPILMTTSAMILGVMPLLFASGAGARSRFVMGLVISSGLGIGTIFTLLIVPAFYVMLAADHRSNKNGSENV